MDMNWQYAWSQPKVTGELKSNPQDFYVEEVLGFEPDGQGEHLFVLIEKVAINTDYLAQRLAHHANIDVSKVTYSGVKDRHACTRQWFCLHVLNASVTLDGLVDEFVAPEKIQILRLERHSKKLKVGTHKANKFVIRLRNITGDLSELMHRLELIKMAGVPNYYGPQRFGIGGNNLHNGEQWLARGRQSRKKLTKTESFWLSAIRSWCFNQALSDQVAVGAWATFFIGDIAQENTSVAQFRVKQLDATLFLRQLTMQIHPVMPLISKGWQDGTSALRAQHMLNSLVDHRELVDNLLKLDLARDSRTTRLLPQDMLWELLDKDTPETQLLLQFSLPKGSFATSVLRELIDITDRSTERHNENTNSQ